MSLFAFNGAIPVASQNTKIKNKNPFCSYKSYLEEGAFFTTDDSGIFSTMLSSLSTIDWVASSCQVSPEKNIGQN